MHQPHRVYLVNDEITGIPDSLWKATCTCGHATLEPLLSAAQRKIDAHCGITVSHIHTADVLSK
jgi:hypothetical protein